jgi:hypothetical protein
MSKLIRYFTHISLADRLPRVPRGYSTDFDLKAVSDDEAALMRMSALRSPHSIERLKRRYAVQSARELVAMLPKKHKPYRGARLMPLIRRVFGTTAYDPMKRYYLEHRRKGRR